MSTFRITNQNELTMIRSDRNEVKMEAWSVIYEMIDNSNHMTCLLILMGINIIVCGFMNTFKIINQNELIIIRSDRKEVKNRKSAYLELL